MSSMRNAVQRRNHKERAQPAEREKWGLLEKRKDYKLRAADHKQKKQKLKLLSQKARDRNPDEFSFKMMSSKVDKQGKKVADRGNVALSQDVVKLLKTQDAGYLRTILQQTRREREELEQKLIMEGDEVKALKEGERIKQGKHRVYVEDEEQQHTFDPAAWFGRGEDLPESHGDLDDGLFDDEDAEEDVGAGRKTPSKKQIEAEELAKREKRAFNRSRSQAQLRIIGRLEAVKKREGELVAAEQELELQRAKMNNTVGGVNKHGVKFKVRERKR
ncbi:U3 snoRNP-associated protein-like protein Utp11 [Setomelanomma holmii]|uniref:U3 snoRNP-associated protein-like protein Utp11 n=1 Tax=Setomelanomma holmii TaxID=210430 RepID=A0A9P4LM56_9PLEO|nr:U3 snoRNP-associated protein-like protein Utp11 [Setomelanomma holmii]